VECLAKVGFVFRVTRDIFKFADSVRELTLLAVFALAIFAKLTTQLSLISAQVAKLLLLLL